MSVKKKYLFRILSIVLLSLFTMTLANCTFEDSQIKDGFVLKERPFSKKQSDQIRTILLKKSTTEKPELVIEQNGKLYYRNCDSKMSDFDMDEETSIELAKNELKDLGLLPNSEYSIEVDVIQPFEKNIYFLPVYNGLDIVSDEEDGIIVCINKNGLDTLQYYWRDIVPVSDTNPISTDSLLDENEAMKVYKRELARNHPEIAEEGDDWPIIVSQVYRYIDGNSVKAWVFSDGQKYLNPIYIDMLTGEPI